MENKRGQGLTVGTIILIILGIAVLVVLVFGFSTGWGNLWERITTYSSSSNVDTVKQACELACSGSQKNAWCMDTKTLKRSNKTSVVGSCENFKSELGISCSISCGDNKYKQTCEDLGGEWKSSCGDMVIITASEIGDDSTRPSGTDICCSRTSKKN